MRHIDPNKLAIADTVIFTDMAPFAEVIRARTWPKRSIFDMSLGTHCGTIVDRGGGLYYVAEMLADGLVFSELQKYDNGPRSWLRHIVAIKRHPLFWDGDSGAVRQTLANDWMIKQHSFGVKYGYDELVRFVDPDRKCNPYRMICSVWCEAVWGYCNIPMPFSGDLPTSPADWQRWTSSVITVQGVVS
jgi:hypothetical protein